MHKLHPDDPPWANIEPSSELIYHPCFDGLQCARLKVPLDWNNTDPNYGTVAIALLKVPAKVPITDPHYGGPLFVNPGGPGASGTHQALTDRRKLQSIIEASADAPLSNGKYHDIIGFDPRSVKHTTPRLLCFPDAHARRDWVLQSQTEGTVGTSSTATAKKRARWSSLAETCAERTKHDPRARIAPARRTPRPRNSGVPLPPSSPHHIPPAPRLAPHRHPPSKRQATPPLLNFWAQSYGTYIATTFASLFPDRVGHLVLDSVKIPSEAPARQRNASIIHADAIVARFFDLCHRAGPDVCPLYDGAGPRKMQDDFDRLLAYVNGTPIAVPGSGRLAPDVVTWSDVMGMVRSSPYDSIRAFPSLARMLAEVRAGNGTSVARRKQGGSRQLVLPKECAEDGPFSPRCTVVGGREDEVNPAVSCSDAVDLGRGTVEGFEDYLRGLEGQSRYIARHWGELNLKCAGWAVGGRWRFVGPFTGKTRTPMLVVNNMLDPVTPVENAFAVAEAYPGAAVLQQDGIGHITVDTKSACTAQVIRAYFQDDKLPEHGSVCPVDELPFGIEG
ncbi:hypothetical protein B9Z65_8812 [Elsinoe australis]|uniref:Peptidase S33 tripeptidyl aminopeptidase-like C-terminal domain-containing protein n=1 Tax=Elsinoe australis TaxID=40998 RepID=A0A2P7YEU0_9PEZI|nr:hypothetical protein B9Z65_8812 [Elsinoe australis]